MTFEIFVRNKRPLTRKYLYQTVLNRNKLEYIEIWMHVFFVFRSRLAAKVSQLPVCCHEKYPSQQIQEDAGQNVYVEDNRCLWD